MNDPLGRRAAALLLVAVTVGLHWKLLLTGEFSWLAGPETARHTLPRLAFQTGEWRSFRPAMWNPYPGGGESLAARPESGWANPLLWVMAALPRPGGWFSQASLHWYFVLVMRLLPAWCAYRLARRLGCGRIGALLGGLTYSCLGWLGGAWTIEEATAGVWLPLGAVLLAGLPRGSFPLPSAAIAGFVLGLCALTGNGPVLLPAALATLGFWILALRQRPCWPTWAGFLAFWVSAISCSSLVLLPARHAFWTEAARWQPLLPSAWPGLILPGWGHGTTQYCGAAALCLAGLALWRGRADTRIRWGGAILLAGWILSPSLAGLALAMLAASGMDRILERDEPLGTKALGVAGVALLAASALHRPESSEGPTLASGFALAAVVCLLAAALLTARRFGAIGARGLAAGWLALVCIEATNGGLARLISTDRAGQMAPIRALAGQAGLARRLALELGESRVWVDPAVAEYDFGSWFGIETGPVAATAERARLLGVRYRMARAPAPPHEQFVFDGGQDLQLYRSAEATPKVYLVRSASPAPETCGGPDIGRLTLRRPGETHVRTETPCGGRLVVADNWDPGWRVTVDGRAAPLLRHRETLLAVDVPAGRHEVAFRYAPAGVLAGVVLALASAAAALASLAAARWSRAPG